MINKFIKYLQNKITKYHFLEYKLKLNRNLMMSVDLYLRINSWLKQQ